MYILYAAVINIKSDIAIFINLAFIPYSDVKPGVKVTGL